MSSAQMAQRKSTIWLLGGPADEAKELRYSSRVLGGEPQTEQPSLAARHPPRGGPRGGRQQRTPCSQPEDAGAAIGPRASRSAEAAQAGHPRSRGRAGWRARGVARHACGGGKERAPAPIRDPRQMAVTERVYSWDFGPRRLGPAAQHHLGGHGEARARRARAACSRAQESLGQLLQQALRGNLFVRVLRSWLLSHLLVDLLQMGTTAASVQHAKG